MRKRFTRLAPSRSLRVHSLFAFAMPVMVSTALVMLIVPALAPARARPVLIAQTVSTAVAGMQAPAVEIGPVVSTPTVQPTTTTVPSPVITTTSLAPPPTTTTTAAPPASVTSRFALPPGATLPSDAVCAKQVTKTKERRAANAGANKTKPSSLPVYGEFAWGSDKASRSYLGRVNGHYTGTTDEIIEWASCKWGFDPDVTRAQAFVESTWRQGATAAPTEDEGKCVGGMALPCPLAFGIMQLRVDKHPGTYPASASSTAFNLDYALGMRRACYDGHLWVGEKGRGDLWGCVGVHYSGKLNNEPALDYIAKVQLQYRARPWVSWK